ncbi:Succinyl-CoA ligase [ADP-forming] subunit alpha [Delftia tsuruhatensis]|uniref:acetate--CoA ligase family protein n=1 Tax=Delftia tsuruhatensis TaxID=180282 RepID=UPI001E7377EB|nr:acetate--CoA ligase family protein [Delftia tsuruhatensis]CAB5713023.1 Succinyl-CoA ligase [ADP-forming] subunit alpha [Delftia tsuruhatensis]CAC9691867.1 Succinyl-CoA ligase [ADP-forming] subunit alpha [Delftia tsuruhatensis]
MTDSDFFDTARLDALFAPRSIAVVGASDQASKIGGIPLDYLLRFGYGGDLYAVNPRAGRVQGLPAHERLAAIGAPVDLAIVAVPQSQVAGVLEDAAAARVRSMVLFSSGYAETGAEGTAAQQALAQRARAAGIRLIGPNCLGFMRPGHQVYATFSPAPGAGLVRPGRIGMVSQSGAFGAYAYSLARERGLGLSLWATTGNEADVQLADGLAWLAQDPETDVIMAYMEGCRDGPRLRAALALAQAHGKPVVMCKVGTSALGAAAAASHTASLAGNDAVHDAVFRRYGVLRAHSISDFFSLAASASIARAPRGKSIGLFTVSGGVGAMMADDASAAGLDVAPLSDAAQRQLREWVPFAAPRNPVDITGQVTNDMTLLERSASLMLADRRFDSWLGFFAAGGLSDAFWPVLQALVRKLRAEHPDTLLAVSTLCPPERRDALEAMGCLVFADPGTAIRCIGALASLPKAPVCAAQPAAPGAHGARPLPPGAQSEQRSMALLAEAGVPVVPHRLVRTAQEAAQAVQALGGRIVLKVHSDDIPHKSDVGGVALNLADAGAGEAAFARILASARQARPEACIDGALAAPMVQGGVECIAGVHRDPVFGPVLMFGLGGIHSEILRDVSLRVLPVTRDDALAMVRELRAFAVLDGARGRAPVDLDAIADTLCALAGFAEQAGATLDSAEINPLIARPRAEGGCVAVDALVIGREAACAATPLPSLAERLP